MSIRFAAASDCAAMLAIYAPYIETTITFEQEVPSQQEFAARLETVQQEYPWIVWEEDGKILGYAYAHKFAERVSYRPSAELSVYLDRAARGPDTPKALPGAFCHRAAAERQIGLRHCDLSEREKRSDASGDGLYAGIDAQKRRLQGRLARCIVVLQADRGIRRAVYALPPDRTA